MTRRTAEVSAAGDIGAAFGALFATGITALDPGLWPVPLGLGVWWLIRGIVTATRA